MPSWIWEHPDWPGFRWSETEISPVLVRARFAQGRILGAASLLDPALTLDAAASILVEDGLKTSAIEGERLDLDAVRSSVARHLGLPTDDLPVPSRSVDGLIDVLLDATRRFDVPLTQERLSGWQAALFPTGTSGLRPIRAGQLRGADPMEVVSGGMGGERVHFLAPPRERLEAELSRFLAWFEEPPGDLDGLLRAGVAHLWFITLHPFEDGNGRLARAVTDMAIARDDRRPMRLFSLSAQIQRERRAYYDVLERTQRGTLEVTDWLAWFLDTLARAVTSAQGTLDAALARARFWQRWAGTPLNQRQVKLLSRLLDGLEGKLTSSKWAAIAKCSPDTALRDITLLLELGVLKKSAGGGRSTSYELAD